MLAASVAGATVNMSNSRMYLIGLALLFGIPHMAGAQVLYRCVGKDGVPSYQQVPCPDDSSGNEVAVRRQPEPAYPPGQSVNRDQGIPDLVADTTTPVDFHDAGPSAPQPDHQPPSGYIRCIRPNGDIRIVKGTSCPLRHESVPQQAGMVRDVGSGQQVFMVPGGGNGMIDPTTGQRHELISPPPTRAVRDQAVPVSRDQACREAAAARDAATSDANRTIHSIRRAEDNYRTLCG